MYTVYVGLAPFSSLYSSNDFQHHKSYINMAPQWADQPYSLISTTAFSQDVRPRFKPVDRIAKNAGTQKSHAANYVATEMSLAHNGMIRGLNSIYIQAPNLPKHDHKTVADFLTYCQCWSESMHHHHDMEEQEFFPSIERLSGVQGLMARNYEQHKAFTPGFEEFHAYARDTSPKDYDGQKVQTLVEGFAEPLTQHLHDEIESLRALSEYDSKEVREAYKRLEKLLMDTDNVKSISNLQQVEFSC